MQTNGHGYAPTTLFTTTGGRLDLAGGHSSLISATEYGRNAMWLLKVGHKRPYSVHLGLLEHSLSGSSLLELSHHPVRSPSQREKLALGKWSGQQPRLSPAFVSSQPRCWQVSEEVSWWFQLPAVQVTTQHWVFLAEALDRVEQRQNIPTRPYQNSLWIVKLLFSCC